MYAKLIKIYSFIIALYPISLALECFVPHLGAINNIFYIFLPLLIIIVNKDRPKINLALLGMSYSLMFISLFVTHNMSIHENHIANITFLINNLLMITCLNIKTDIYTETLKKKNLLFLGILINLISNLFIICIGKGYSASYSHAWNVNALCGIYGDPHQCAYKTIGILTVILFLIKNVDKNKMILLLISIIFTFITLMTAARVPTVFAVLIELIILSNYRLKIKVDNPNVRQIIIIMTLFSLALITILCIGYNLLINSSFLEKTLLTFNKNYLDNGRSVFRELDIMFFNQQSLFHKLFGSGAETTYNIHLQNMGLSLWAHNDFIQILLSFGLLMLIVYIFILLKYCFSLKKSYRFIFSIIIGIWFIAFYNGMYIHTRFIIGLLFLTLYSFNYADDINKKDNYNNNNNKGAIFNGK